MRLSPAASRSRSRVTSIAVLGLLAGLLAVLAPAVPIVSAPAASASSATLCWGYSGCADKGYPHAGYASRSNKMYWRMYSGHNCTNYVAYRMIQAGMSSERPWSGSGNAYNWGLAMRKITDQRPAVGAVAWWNRNVPGAGSVGHVAYVEKVVSSTVIIVSQDSWGGDFSWKRIDKGDSGWPSGFIHFRDRNMLQNVSRPVLPGAVRVGVPIRLRIGTWKPGGNKYTYQWMADGRAIRGATSYRFAPLPRHLGMKLTAKVTATRAGQSAVSAVSNATAAVAPGTLASTATPVVTGDPVAGQTLKVTPGRYAPQATGSWAWFADGVALRDATGPTLTLTPAHVGATITVRETATATGYATRQVTSTGVGPVLRGELEMRQPDTGSGELRRGETLTVVRGKSNLTATVEYQWLRDGVPIPGATANTYRIRTGDVGHAFTTRMYRTRPDFRPLTSHLEFGGPATTSSQLKVRMAGRSRSVALRVVLVSPGGDGDERLLRIQVGGRQATGRLKDGYVRVEVPHVLPGVRRVKVNYLGTDVVEASSWSGLVRVAR